MSSLQVTGCSQTLEKEQRHKCAVKEILVRSQMRQRSQMINVAVIVWFLGTAKSSVSFFQLLTSLKEIFHLAFRQDSQCDPAKDRRTRRYHNIYDSTYWNHYQLINESFEYKRMNYIRIGGKLNRLHHGTRHCNRKLRGKWGIQGERSIYRMGGNKFIDSTFNCCWTVNQYNSIWSTGKNKKRRQRVSSRRKRPEYYIQQINIIEIRPWIQSVLQLDDEGITLSTEFISTRLPCLTRAASSLLLYIYTSCPLCTRPNIHVDGAREK